MLREPVAPTSPLQGHGVTLEKSETWLFAVATPEVAGEPFYIS
jgi:hypothetical protein